MNDVSYEKCGVHSLTKILFSFDPNIILQFNFEKANNENDGS